MNTKQVEKELINSLIEMVREHDKKLRSVKIKVGIRNAKRQS
ncbi:hypothetical protein [Maribacter luteus]|nr:hypothetical protein [Maribacter luteus]